MPPVCPSSYVPVCNQNAKSCNCLQNLKGGCTFCCQRKLVIYSKQPKMAGALVPAFFRCVRKERMKSKNNSSQVQLHALRKGSLTSKLVIKAAVQPGVMKPSVSKIYANVQHHASRCKQ
eukprot:1158227-Pelagomonas_calceolata.AAC.3